MARGNEAKEKLMNKIIQMPNISFIGCYDKKYYFFEEENGEQVQIAISLTCPKNPIQIDTNVSTDAGDWDFSDNPKVNTTVAVANAAPAEITEEEKANIADLLLKLGL